ncbi:hypothetical protein GWI33_010481 [Rhynchophorus ferrugineus]|uniref:Uncharacterized protein n=1 Tax=Rhynchophorus ferrugineus TaxID=354439 RepID=A0A834IQZ8_RHYFE|nr:hypothetical protein GWI33_010481 [Rhynchophorus ferrugineus]
MAPSFHSKVQSTIIRVDCTGRTHFKAWENATVGWQSYGVCVCVTNLVPSGYFLFPDLKIMLSGKKFSSNEEVILGAETEAYFEEKNKSYYKNGIEKLEGRYNQYITLEGNYVE